MPLVNPIKQPGVEAQEVHGRLWPGIRLLLWNPIDIDMSGETYYMILLKSSKKTDGSGASKACFGPETRMMLIIACLIFCGSKTVLNVS